MTLLNLQTQLTIEYRPINHFNPSIPDFFYSCCQSDRQTFELPVRCFERNGCVGLHWLSEDACSKKYRESIKEKINKLKTESVDSVDI